ncbi:tail assembly protein [Enterococcus phage 9184]|uniref:Tail assembly protein n=1 Tax=Enterococcus phage 9184 TaxID=2763103 RepID=A0A7L8ZIG2_9CAUD|nr:tail assembly protein [Enterococcus phage 9184]
MQAQGIKIINNMQIETSSGTVYWQEEEPTNPKDGDAWFKVINGKATNSYNRENGQWVEVEFASQIIAEELIGKIITAAEINGGVINGTTISGAKFLNEYVNAVSGVNQVTDGTLKIENGILQAGSSYYLTDSAGTKLYKSATTEADIHQGAVNLIQKLYNNAGVQTSQSSASISGGLISLSLSDASGNYNGVLDAKALTNTPWKTLPLDTSMYTVAENNPPMYRIIYNLDGSKTVKFKGQLKLISGNMKEGSEYYPFRKNNAGNATLLPNEIIPDQTEFAFAAGGLASGFKGNNGGRIGMTRTPNMVISPGSGEYAYFGISSLSYDIL